MDTLIFKLKNIEKQNYRAYQQIKGQYDFTDFDLSLIRFKPILMPPPHDYELVVLGRSLTCNGYAKNRKIINARLVIILRDIFHNWLNQKPR